MTRPDPRTVLAAGAMIIFIAMGTRHSFGLFLDPMTHDLGVGRGTFGLAAALQNLLWGLGQPVAGMIADRFGTRRVVFAGGALYAGGLAVAALGAQPAALHLGLGVMVGLGLSATSFAVVLGAVGRHFPVERRTRALAIATAGGSAGTFVSVPATLALIDGLGWAGALLGLAAVAAAMSVLALALRPAEAAAPAAGPQQTLRDAVAEAMGHRGYVLLVLGFFVCGFQLAFIGTHLPAFLGDRGLDLWVGGTALAVIGAANVVGTMACGLLGDRLGKKNLLVALYTTRAVATVGFLWLPVTPASVLAYALVMGLTWLGTVPLTSGIVAQVFGARYMATLVGVVFLMHQAGSFLGAWLGGIVFDATGSYEPVWWSVAALGLAAAVLHWPIDDRPLVRRHLAVVRAR